MKRVLIYGMTNNKGGVESYIVNQIPIFEKNNIICDFLVDFPSMAYQSEMEKMGSKIFFIPKKSDGVMAHLKAIYNVLKNNSYSSMYFNILDAGTAVTMFVPWVLGVSIVTHSHNGNTDKKLLHNICRPWLILFTKYYYACSIRAAEFMFGRKNVGKTTILYNAIDIGRFMFDQKIRDEYRKLLDLEDTLTVIHIGRITRQKNPTKVLSVFKNIVEKKNNSTLLYLGTGDMEKEIFQQVEELGIKEKVKFYQQRDDVAEIMQAADAFLLPSLYEGFPISAVEAQASGLPCFLSNDISDEIKISQAVYFLNKEDSDELWADAIISHASENREIDVKLFSAKGIDKSSDSPFRNKLIVDLKR